MNKQNHAYLKQNRKLNSSIKALNTFTNAATHNSELAHNINMMNDINKMFKSKIIQSNKSIFDQLKK